MQPPIIHMKEDVAMNEERAPSIRDDVWITQKSRMKSEQRLHKYNKYLNFLIVYYAFFLICLSVFRLGNSSFGVNASAELVLSVGVFSLSIFAFASDFGGGASKYRECYLRLGKLLASTKSDEDIRKEYNEILAGYENHKEADYTRLVIERKLIRKQSLKGSSGKEVEMSWLGYTKYFATALALHFIAILPLFVPIGLLFLSNISGEISEC